MNLFLTKEQICLIYFVQLLQFCVYTLLLLNKEVKMYRFVPINNFKVNENIS